MERFTTEIFKASGNFVPRTSEVTICRDEDEARDLAAADFLQEKNKFIHSRLVYYVWQGEEDAEVINKTLVATAKRFKLSNLKPTKKYIEEATKFYTDRFDYLCKNLDMGDDKYIQYYILHNGVWDNEFQRVFDVEFGWSPADANSMNYRYQFNNIWKYSFGMENFDIYLFLKDWMYRHKEGVDSQHSWIESVLSNVTTIEAMQLDEAYQTLLKAVGLVCKYIECSSQYEICSILIDLGYNESQARDIIQWYKKQSNAKKFSWNKYCQAKQEARRATINFMIDKKMIVDNHWNKYEAHKHLPGSVYQEMIEEDKRMKEAGLPSLFREERKVCKQHKPHKTKDFSQELIKTQDHCLYFPKKLSTNPNFRAWWKANEESYKESGITKLKFVDC